MLLRSHYFPHFLFKFPFFLFHLNLLNIIPKTPPIAIPVAKVNTESLLLTG